MLIKRDAIVSMIVWNEFLNDARVLKEAQTLQSAGYRVMVHALHTPGVTQEHETLPCGVKVVRVGRSPFWKWRKKHKVIAKGQSQAKKPSGRIKKLSLISQLLRIVARSWTHLGLLYRLVRSKPDVVHAHDVNTLPTAWLASVLARVPLVYDAHEISTDREGYASFRKVVGWIEKKLMPRAAGTITTTDTRAKFFALAYKIPRPLVLQNRPRLTAVANTNRIRKELKLEENWPIVLYQGGLQQGRGLERFIDASHHVKQAYFIFIGGGRLETALAHKVAEDGLQDQVFFLGVIPLQDLPEYTASADIGVQALQNTCLNHYSTDSNKIFEYMMAGLPVVATNFPEIRKIVRTHDFGLLFDDKSELGLSDAINLLLQDKKIYRKLSKNAKKARCLASWEKQEQGLLDMYDRIVTGRL